MQHRMLPRALTVVALLLLAGGVALAADAMAPAKPAPKPAGPAVKMKVTQFDTLETAGIVQFQFLDKAGNPTKAPEGGEIAYTTNITNPRKGTLSMANARFKAEEKIYVLTGVAPRQRIVCPPRAYTITLTFKAGKTKFTASLTTKLLCT